MVRVRKMPAQIAVLQICGHDLPVGPQYSMEENMRKGACDGLPLSTEEVLQYERHIAK